MNSALCRVLGRGLSCGLLGVAPLAAQQTYGAIAGTVVDSSGRGVLLAEVIVTGTAARLLTDSTGRFRFSRVPTGNQRLLVRAIGFEPQSIPTSVPAGSSTNLGPVVLKRLVQTLAALEVVGALPRPTFNLGNYVALDDGRDAPTYRYAWFGASMTDDGLYLVPASFGQHWLNEWIEYRIRFGVSSDRVFGTACAGAGVYQVAATRVIGQEVALLTEAGVVWKAAAQAARISPCEKFASFPFQSPLQAAAGIDSGWVVVVGSPEGRVLGAVDELGKPIWEKRLSQVLDVELAPDATVTVTPTNSGAIVAMLSAPFEWVELARSGTVLLRGSPLRGSAIGDSLRGHAGPGWKAFGVFPIPNGYVQTIESDNRETGWHMVYDLLGRPTRLAPRGIVAVLVASRPERRRVFGFSYHKGGMADGQLFVQWY